MVCTHAITDRHAQTTAQDSAETHSTRRQEAVGYKKQSVSDLLMAGQGYR